MEASLVGEVSQREKDDSRASSGIAGLDDILGGGFPRNRLYLVQGDPGAGKTTLALQFLMAGADRGERVLYVSLSESREEILQVAASHGWNMDNVDIHEYTPGDQLQEQLPTTVFHPAEMELGETVRGLLDAVEQAQPQRAVFDSLSELMLLASDPLRYRREILSLKHYFAGRDCTVMLLDDLTTGGGDRQLHSLCHGVLALSDSTQDYGAARNRIRVTKLRGVRFRGGYHDYVIRTGGLEVFPRLVANEFASDFAAKQIESGVSELDALLGGGLDVGTSTLLLGPSGCGKSTIATRYVMAAVEAGEKAAMFLFEESPAVLFQRSKSLSMDLQEYVKSGLLSIQSIDPAELAPNEFVKHVQDAVEKDGARTIVIDSLNGYLNAMPGERYLFLQLHEMLTYLAKHAVTTILVSSQQGMLASAPAPGLDVSYIADTVILFRYFEHAGSVRQALSVMKRRSGAHERTIRELTLGGEAGIAISEPLRGFRGILSGVPIYEREKTEG